MDTTISSRPTFLNLCTYSLAPLKYYCSLTPDGLSRNLDFLLVLPTSLRPILTYRHSRLTNYTFLPIQSSFSLSFELPFAFHLTKQLPS